MTRAIPANGRALRQRLTDTGMSERELTRRTGLGSIAIRGILFSDSLSTSMTIADVQRCLGAVGMTWGDLLDDAATAPVEPSPKRDISTLGSLLAGARTATTADRLARALGWKLSRVTQAASGLGEQLRPLGLRLRRDQNGYAIRPLDLTTHDALTRLNEIRDDEDGMHTGMARVLHQALTGSLSKRESKNDHMVQIGALLNRDAIKVSTESGERYVLTDGVRYALDF